MTACLIGLDRFRCGLAAQGHWVRAAGGDWSTNAAQLSSSENAIANRDE